MTASCKWAAEHRGRPVVAKGTSAFSAVALLLWYVVQLVMSLAGDD